MVCYVFKVALSASQYAAILYHFLGIRITVGWFSKLGYLGVVHSCVTLPFMALHSVRAWRGHGVGNQLLHWYKCV